MPRIIDDLLLAVADGSRPAFAELHERMRTRLIALALTVVRDRGLAEDVVQEVLADVWLRPGRFDASRGSAVAWLLRLTHGCAIDRVRAEEHDRHRASEWGARGLVDCGESADERLDLAGRLTGLRSALLELTPMQREALVATHLEGRTYREVAERLGVPVGTVKTRAHDGMLRLRDLLGAPAVLAAPTTFPVTVDERADALRAA